MITTRQDNTQLTEIRPNVALIPKKPQRNTKSSFTGTFLPEIISRKRLQFELTIIPDGSVHYTVSDVQG